MSNRVKTILALIIPFIIVTLALFLIRILPDTLIFWGDRVRYYYVGTTWLVGFFCAFIISVYEYLLFKAKLSSTIEHITLNRIQRIILTIVIVVVTYFITYKIAGHVGGYYSSRYEMFISEPFTLNKTWWVWALSIAIIGTFELWLFRNKKKVE